MKKAIFTALIILSLLTSLMAATQTFEAADAQTPSSTQTWNRIISGGAEDAAWSVIQTADGGYAVACNTWSFSTGMDARLIKTDASGKTQWSRTYEGPSWDGANSVVATSDGGYVIAGSTGSATGSTGFFDGVNMDCWLIKTDSSGNVLWNKTYGGTGTEYGRAVIQTSDGGYAVAGHAFSSVEAGRENFWLLKTDAFGNMEWNQTYGGAHGDLAYSIVATSDGGYALAGSTSSFGGNGCLLVKTDAFGNMQWNQTYPAQSSRGSHSLITTPDGGYVLSGTVYASNFEEADLWIARTDLSGNLQWSQTYQGKAMNYPYAIVSTSDGGYAVAGQTTTKNVEESDCLLIKTDAAGNLQWKQTYGGPYADAAYSMVQATDGGYMVAGSWSYLANSVLGGDVWLIKTDSEGNTPEMPPIPTPTSSLTPPPTPTASPAPTPSPTSTSMFNPAASPNPTSTPKPSPTASQMPTATPTPVPTPTPTPTSDPTIDATHKPRAVMAAQPQMPNPRQEPENETASDWVPVTIAAFAVVAVGVAVCCLWKRKHGSKS